MPSPIATQPALLTNNSAAYLPDRIKGADLRRSLWFCTTGWAFGAFWAASATGGATINRFVEYLSPAGQKDFFIGLVSAAAFIGVLCQLPGAIVIEYLGQRKKFFLTWVTAQRSLYLVIAILPWVLPAHHRASIVILATLLIVGWCLGQYGGQAWTNWMADLVPPRVRGKYFARRSRMGITVMALTSLLMGVLMDASSTQWFNAYLGPIAQFAGMDALLLVISVIFLFASVAGIVDIQIFRKVDEPRMGHISRDPIAMRLLKPLKDRQFMRYVAYLSCFNFTVGFTNPFWWFYLFGFYDLLKAGADAPWWLQYYYLSAYLMLPLSYQIGQFIGYPVWGMMIDRFGRKPIIFISSFAHTFSWVAWFFITPALLPWLMLVQLFGGFFGSGQEVANFNMLLAFNRKGGAGYQAVAQVIASSAFAVASIVAGILATKFLFPIENSFGYVFQLGGRSFGRYHALILIGIMLKWGADLVLLPYIHDLEAKPTSHAVRFLLGNMYGYVNTQIFTPLRTIPEVTGSAVRRFNDAAEDAVEGVKNLFK